MRAAPRRGRADTVGASTGLAAAAFQRAGFTDPTLVLCWAEIAGPEVARLAQPFRFADKGGVLTLRAEPGAALFLGHESRALCERINAYLGRPAVTRLRFVQGGLAARRPVDIPPKPAGTLSSADPARRYRGPPGLGEALVNLARWRVRRPEKGGD